jgi:hypothetical protein
MKSKWEVAGFCEDNEIEYDNLKNCMYDFQEQSMVCKIEQNTFGYVLYVKIDRVIKNERN